MSTFMRHLLEVPGSSLQGYKWSCEEKSIKNNLLGELRIINYLANRLHNEQSLSKKQG